MAGDACSVERSSPPGGIMDEFRKLVEDERHRRRIAEEERTALFAEWREERNRLESELQQALSAVDKSSSGISPASPVAPPSWTSPERSQDTELQLLRDLRQQQEEDESQREQLLKELRQLQTAQGTQRKAMEAQLADVVASSRKAATDAESHVAETLAELQRRRAEDAAASSSRAHVLRTEVREAVAEANKSVASTIGSELAEALAPLATRAAAAEASEAKIGQAQGTATGEQEVAKAVALVRSEAEGAMRTLREDAERIRGELRAAETAAQRHLDSEEEKRKAAAERAGKRLKEVEEQRQQDEAAMLRLQAELRKVRDAEAERREEDVRRQYEWREEKRELKWQAEHRELEWKAECQQLEFQADLRPHSRFREALHDAISLASPSRMRPGSAGKSRDSGIAGEVADVLCDAGVIPQTYRESLLPDQDSDPRTRLRRPSSAKHRDRNMDEIHRSASAAASARTRPSSATSARSHHATDSVHSLPAGDLASSCSHRSRRGHTGKTPSGLLDRNLSYQQVAKSHSAKWHELQRARCADISSSRSQLGGSSRGQQNVQQMDELLRTYGDVSGLGTHTR
eukprot:gnl/TRDRNA2_/TRDRNA2_160573_c5_seq1.p1 gnl/TRDRNA2_/TRDRNA2_160573_c5~~gnl/TRDRNA2_/TRDRNA2_160573_c5_seq1.p1  ORF type:complete len:609 (-),score=148.13 gnl/TRDRNA2_/TRDRNA2_160573_c5_seq1:80-1807(-)